MKTLTFGKKTILYSLNRAERKTLAITVQPDLRVEVCAPQEAEDAAIERVLRKRAAWILRQQRFFTQFLPRTPLRQFVSGETHLYLGRQYRLRIRQAHREEVKLIGGYIYVYVQELAAKERIKELLYQWYSVHAQIRLRERLTSCMQTIAGWKIPAPELSIRQMSRCWGSCSPAGKLTLNLDLIRAPRACIDYVILHELCHLRYPNHAPDFYNLLSSILPDWKERKLRLEKIMS